MLGCLRQAQGAWVDAPDLATPEVGGFGGTRRMRELRQMGWDIETRQKPGDPNVWQHRLSVGENSSASTDHGPPPSSLTPEERAEIKSRAAQRGPAPNSRQVLKERDGKQADRQADAKKSSKASSSKNTKGSEKRKADLEERLRKHKEEREKRKREEEEGDEGGLS